MSDLTFAQRKLLDLLFDLTPANQVGFVPGLSLRLEAPDKGAATERGTLLRSLAPRYVTVSGQEPDQDRWALRLEGLLASSHGEFATFWIEAVLELYRRKVAREGAFAQIFWSELAAHANHTSQIADETLVVRVNWVIVIAELTSKWSKDQPPTFWYWNRPSDLEVLLNIDTASELLDHRVGRKLTDEQKHIIDIVTKQYFMLDSCGWSSGKLLRGEVSASSLAERTGKIRALTPRLLQVRGVPPDDVYAPTLVGALNSTLAPRIRLLLDATLTVLKAQFSANRLFRHFTVQDVCIALSSLGHAVQIADDQFLHRVYVIANVTKIVERVGDQMTWASPYSIEEICDLGNVSDFIDWLGSRTIQAATVPALSTQRSSIDARQDTFRRADIGVITIKEEEFEAVLDTFPREGASGLYLGPATHRHYNLREADAGNGSRYTLAIVRQAEQGTGEAQTLARDIVEDLNPALLLVVGIAGAPPTNDLTLGDVVVSTRINDYTLHASQSGRPPEYAIGGGAIAKSIANGVANLLARRASLGEWWNGLPPRPSVNFESPDQYNCEEHWARLIRSSLSRHFGTEPRTKPIFKSGVLGSSDQLVKDPAIVIEWLQTARNLLAVEMEAAGVYRAANERYPMLAIRGISDIIGFRRDEKWTVYACRSAAHFARAYLRTTPVAPTGIDTSDLWG